MYENPRSIEEIRSRQSELKTQRESFVAELERLRARQREKPDHEGLSDRIDRIQTGLDRVNDEDAELAGKAADLAKREDYLLKLAERRPELLEPGDGGVPLHREKSYEQLLDPHRDGVRQARDRGLRTIERYVKESELRSQAADTLDELIRKRDSSGLDARYLAAVGDPAYNSAFGKILADPLHGHLRMNQYEVAAFQAVAEVEKMRGLVSGVGAQGGFAIPFTLDPSVMLTSSGALNPIRAEARVITIATREWKGVSSAGVTASYDAEATEVSDDTPVLAQPTITSAMGRAFVPFSIEVEMDWASIQQELAQLISDARDVLDAVQFYSGTGTDSPAGVRTGLTTSQRVQTDVAATLDIDDVYDLKGQLPARAIPNAVFAMHPNKADSVFRFTPSGSTTEPQAMPERDGPLLGKRVIEWTAIPTALTTGTTQMLYGDFRAAFTIADRLGMTLEVVSHLFGASRRPTGERGAFAYWRTGSKTVVPELLRYLETL
jgi:HK97 family phage major capsid protein